jgi:hypothetical protein
MTTKLIARRRFVAFGRLFNAGAVVPEESVRARRSVLIRNHYLEEVSESQQTVVQPVDLPPAAPPPPKKPKLAKCIVRLSDPVSSVRETFRETRKHFPNEADTWDFLLTSEEFRSMYKLAVASAVSAEKAKYKGQRQSITPDMVGF